MAEGSLRDKLQEYFTTATLFEMPAANDLGSDAISKLIRDYLPPDPPKYPDQPTLRVDECTPMDGDDPVTFSGKARLSRDQAQPFDVTLTFQTIDQIPQLVLKTSLAGGWDFAQSFTSLADTTVAALKFEDPAFVLASTEKPEPGGYKFGLNFSGTPQTEGPLKSVGWMIPGISSMLLSSVIRLEADKPIMMMEAPGLISVSIGTLSLKVGIRIETGYMPPDKFDNFFAHVELFSDITIGSASSQVHIPVYVELPEGDPALLTFNMFGVPQSISSYSELNSLANGEDFAKYVPTALPVTPLKVDYLSFAIAPQEKDLASIQVSVSLTPLTPWPLLPMNLLTIKQISVAFGVLRPMQPRPIIKSRVQGQFVFGETFAADVAVTFPELIVTAGLAPYSTVKVDELVEHFLKPIFGPVPGVPALEVYQLDLSANIPNSTYSFTAGVNVPWTIPLPLVSLELINITSSVAYETNDLMLFFQAKWLFETVEFDAIANKPAGDNGWNFSLAQAPNSELDLMVILEKFFNANPWRPPFVPLKFAIKDVLLELNTMTQDYHVSGAAVLDWDLTLLPGQTFRVKASLDLRSTTNPAALNDPFSVNVPATNGQPARSYTGTFNGELTVWDFAAKVIYRFWEGNSSLSFSFKFRSIELICTQTTEKDDKGIESVILTANLKGLSFGDILEFLVNLVDPSLGFKLSSPWDVLNEISFDNLTLKINLTKKTVGFEYRFSKPLNLVIVRLDSLGLSYLDKAGKKTVMINIEGKFLDEEFGKQDPLAWDLLNDPPPTPPGQGSQLLDLRYLGIGQNIAFRNVRNFDSVQAVIDAMQKEFLPPANSDQNPLLSSSDLKYSSNSQWLIGADFTVMSTVSLAGVFNDPSLFGLRVALAGEKAKTLSGLSFEILYKKVTDTIGVYHIELKLPDAMRQWEFGVISVTVPIINIDIYTNGNFRIDCGFPVNLDFSASFCVQAWPFIGYGGFYFALLNGSTSEKVPQISNGNFSPVIEFGLALSLGLGKTINKGPLKAGFSLTLVAVLEGVLAWFNPDDNAVSSDMYYRINGTAALVGKLYGYVDFVVIKAEVDVKASASVTLVAEAYQPILVRLQVSVEVSVSIKILFIRIHFSFGISLDMSFTIGSKGTPPWREITSSRQVTNPFLLRQQQALPRRMPISPIALYRGLLQATGEEPAFDWTPRNVFGGSIEQVHLSMVPAFTVALPKTLFTASLDAAQSETGPQVQAVMMLLAQNSVRPEARLAREVRLRAAQDSDKAPFNLLVEGMLLWAIGSLEKAPQSAVFGQDGENKVSIVQLEAIAEFLDKPSNWKQVFTYDQIVAFIELNYVLRISTPVVAGPTGMTGFNPALGATGPTAPEVSATVFPMIPDIEMIPQGMDPVQFWKHNCISEKYEQNLDEYFKQLQVDYLANVARDPIAKPAEQTGPVGLSSTVTRSSQNPEGCTGGKESLATLIFRDYFALITKAAVQSALDLLNSYKYKPTGSESLESLAEEFDCIEVEYRVRAGDTLGAISSAFGAHPPLLRRANPWLEGVGLGERLPVDSAVRVTVGPSPVTIAAANADYPLNYVAHDPVRLTINGVKHQILSGEIDKNLFTIARDFGISDVGSIFAPFPDLTNPNATNAGLLEAGGKMKLPPINYRVQPGDMLGGDPLARIAAFYFVRNLEQVRSPFVSWYKQTIFDLNQQSHTPDILDVPVAVLDSDGSLKWDDRKTTRYAVKPGDTLDLIAGYFDMVQLQPDDPAFKQFRESIKHPTPIKVDSLLEIPGFDHAIKPGDTFESIAVLFNLDVVNLARFNSLQEGMLRPLSVLLLPTLDYPIGEGETLSSIATLLNLTVEELAISVSRCERIFTPYDESTGALTIPEVPCRDITSLTRDLIEWGEFNSISAMVARFLMHGLRVPKPDDEIMAGLERGQVSSPRTDDLNLWGLYEMIGQQLQAPPETTPLYEVSFSKGGTADWLCFEPPSGPSGRAQGPTGCLDQLVIKMDSRFLSEQYPGTTFSPQILSGPTGLTLYQETPERYSMQQSLHWQATTRIQLPGPTGMSGPSGPTGQVRTRAGEPSIWMFPETLNRKISESVEGPTAGTPPYELVAGAVEVTAGSQNQMLERYSWATAIELMVQRVPSDSVTEFMPNSYLMVGADQAVRDLLLEAWSHVQQSRSLRDRLYLLYQPSLTSSNPGGLASDNINQSQTFLLKTNLSTVTHSGVQLSAMSLKDQFAIPFGKYYSRIESVGQFLQLIWEASITGTGGFYLNYVNQNGGMGLPDELFANGDFAKIWLVLLLDNQTRATNPDRRLYPFNNCAVLAENLDAAASSLFARAKLPTRADLRRVANVPAGNIGFQLSRINPDSGLTGPAGPTERENLTRSLYNLVGYQVLANTDFVQSNEGLPVGPVNDEKNDTLTQPTGPTGIDDGRWVYKSVIPISRFGLVNDSPESVALPPSKLNPYRGITGPAGPSGGPRPLSKARLQLEFHDVYGNQTISTQPMLPIDVPVGYTDDVIGVSAWPSAGFSYEFVKGATGGVLLETLLSFQITKYIANISYAYEQAVFTASSDAERYKQIFYQAQQDDMKFLLASNLGEMQIGVDSLKAPMTAFISKSKVFVDTASNLKLRRYETLGTERLIDVSNTYAITPGMLAAANQEVRAADLFAGNVVIPRLVTAAAMNTLERLAANQSSSPNPPDCSDQATAKNNTTRAWVNGIRIVKQGERDTSHGQPDVPVEQGTQFVQLTVEELAENNRLKPLSPGIVLRTETRHTDLPRIFKEGQNTLDAVAALLECVVYGEVTDPEHPDGPGLQIGLYMDNFTAANVVAPNLTITLEGIEVTTEQDTTFKSLHESFSMLEMTVGEFANAIGQVNGIFRSEARVAHADFIIPTPASTDAGPGVPAFSLVDMPDGTGGVRDLAAKNRAVENFYQAGTPIYINYTCETPDPFDSLYMVANRARVTVEQLAAFNALSKLNSGIALEIPNLTFLEDASLCYAPYEPAGADSLFDVGVRFKSESLALAEINRHLPGIFREGVAITVDGKTISPGPLDSLETVYEALRAVFADMTFAQFVERIEKIQGLYRMNGVIVTPLPVMPVDALSQSLTLEEVAREFNIRWAESHGEISAVPLLQANQSLEGFLLDGATIVALDPNADPPEDVTEEVGPFDTVDTIIRRFKDDYDLTVTIEMLAGYNKQVKGLMTAARAFILPPNATPIATSVIPTIPPKGAAGEPSVIFPVNVEIEMDRSRGLVDPAFFDTTPVFKSVSGLTPRGVSRTDSTISLTAFAEAFEEAFKDYSLKCAVSKRNDLGRVKSGPAKVWAVNFGPSGISQFEVQAGFPQFYALKPLSTKLLSGTVLTRTYKSGCGLCAPAFKKFDSVDLDSWMQQFLATVDLFLTTPYSVPAFEMQQGSTGFAEPIASDFAQAWEQPSTGPVGFASGLGGSKLGLAAGPSGATGDAGCEGCTGATAPFGPADYETIVAAKEQVAQGLRHDVIPILDVAGPSGYYLEVAQETLYQQMLVRLSDAYSVNAIIQYPVKVSSPFLTPAPGASGPIPPRVSGKITPELFVISPDADAGGGPPVQFNNNLNFVASNYEVSTPYFAETIADVIGVLMAGATVMFRAGESQIITKNDTLNLIASRFGVPTNPTESDYWERWTEFIAVIGSQGILDPRAGFSVTKISRIVFGGDTLASLSEFMNVDVGSFAHANQDVRAIFNTGKGIKVPGYEEYFVKPDQTLVEIVVGINQHPNSDLPAVPRVTVESLALQLRDETGLLVSGRTLHSVQLLPDFTLSTSKVSLGALATPARSAPALSSLFTVKHPKEFNKLFLNLKYVINEIEYEIKDVPGVKDYKSSSWLTFVIPIGSKRGAAVNVQTEIPQVQVPLPLRSYPTPPSLVGQSGTATHPDADTIKNAKLWDYRFDYESYNAAQDTDHVEVTFNHQEQLSAMGMSRTESVFAALAEFMDAYPQLIKDLASLPMLQAGLYSKTAAFAVQTLAVLAGRVASALNQKSLFAASFASQWPEQTFGYRLKKLNRGDFFHELLLGIEKGASGPSGQVWPEILVQSPTAPTGGIGPDAGFLPLEFKGPSGLTGTYIYPPDIPAESRLTQRFIFKERDIIQNKNGWGGAYLTRNDNLISSGPLGLTGPTGPVETADDFIYQTPLVRFIDRLTPMVSNYEPIDIAALPGPTGGPQPGQRTLNAHLNSMVDAVLDLGPSYLIKAESYMEMVCRYGYSLGETGDLIDTTGLIATVPIRLVPTFLISGGNKDLFVDELSSSITMWRNNQIPSGENGFLIFEFSVFVATPVGRFSSQATANGMALTAGATGPGEALKPILKLNDLRLSMEKIIWSNGPTGQIE